MEEIGTKVELIPGGNTYVLQPSDAGIMKSLKPGIRRRYLNWASKKMLDVAPSSVVSSSDRDTVSCWVSLVFGSPSENCITATFSHIGITNNGSSAPPTPYPPSLFSYVREYDIDASLDEDNIYLQFEY